MDCKIIAHRGSNKVAPQNTLPAFQCAIDEDADGFETDVHVTKDGKLVICHNYTVDATSDGRGNITDYTLGELKKMDFGSYFSAEFKDTHLPTVDEFLDLVGPSNAEVINIELKSPKLKETGMVQKTLDAVKAHGLLDRCLISSFDPRILKEVKALDPRCRTGFLYPTLQASACRFVYNPFPIAKRIAADFIHPMSVVVNPTLVRIAHKLGLGVNVWTVDDRKTACSLAAMGVDGIITNCPGKVKGYLNGMKDEG